MNTTEPPAHLTETQAEIREELRRTDGKAATLLSLVGATLAGVIALTGRDFSAIINAALWTATIPIGAAVMVLLSVLKPVLKDHAPDSWLEMSHKTAAELLKPTDLDLATRRAQQVVRLAEVTRHKYTAIGRAITLLKVGLAILGVALLAQELTSLIH